MKKVLMISTLVLTCGSMAFAAKVRDNCGCGLGSMVLGDQEGLVFHVLGATLNGICGNQTFGISSGSLGCEQVTQIASLDMLRKFVGDNMDQLARDVATGQGDTLTALAVIMDVPSARRTEFNLKMQDRFDVLFPHEQVTADEVVENLQGVI